jgi:hypothetical protein
MNLTQCPSCWNWDWRVDFGQVQSPEAAVVKGLQVIPVQNLREACGFLEGTTKLSPTRVDINRIFDQPLR